MHRLAGDDLEKARTLALRTVVDLRTSGEIERGGRFPVEGHPVDWHHLPIMERMWSEDDLVATTGAVDFLCDRYLDMLRSGGPSIRRIVTLAADGTPMLFHCAAGKDRTGVVAAVLLALAGVPREEIAADYHATAGAMAAFVDWLTVTYPEAIDAMTSQPPEYLEAPHEAMLKFLERVDEHHGSMEGYVTELGVDADHRRAPPPTLIELAARTAVRSTTVPNATLPTRATRPTSASAAITRSTWSWSMVSTTTSSSAERADTSRNIRWCSISTMLPPASPDRGGDQAQRARAHRGSRCAGG